MPFNLPAMVKRTGRRRDVTLRPIIPTQAQATDLATIYAPAWRIWADNIDRILAGYDPQPLPTADALTIDTADQVQTAINGVANEFLTILTARIGPGLRNWLVRAERHHRSRWAAAVKAGAGIEIDMLLSVQDVSETLEVWMGRNAALVRNVSDVTQGKIADAVFRGYQNRTPVREVAAEIRESVGGSRARSIRIASHQSSSLSGTLDLERQAQAGLDKFMWRSSHKKHPRSWHAARDGKVFYLRSRKPVEGGGDAIPSDDMPSQPPACGCRAQAFIPLLDSVE